MADYYNSSTSGPYSGEQQHQQQQQPPYSNSGFYNDTTNNSVSGYPSSSQPSMFHPTTTTTSTGTTADSSKNGQVQSQKPLTASIFNPATAAAMAAAATTGNNEAIFGFAEQAGKNFLEGGTSRLVPGLELFMRTLRPYFSVDNSYVRKKMQRVLCSFIYKEWRRLEVDPMGSNLESKAYESPLSDENALDIYIPSMSLITYVLLCALCYGTAGNFDPGVLSNVMTKCLLTQILEVLGVRIGLYMMQVKELSVIDLFALTGYKYLSLCINMLIGLFLEYIILGSSGTRGFYVAFLYTASSISWFVLKTTANNIPIVTSATGPKREIMVLLFAVSQFATMWFVSQTKYLN